MEQERLERLAMRRPSDDWLSERSSYLGATDVAAIVGLHPYKTPRIVYMEKRGLVNPPELNQAMLHGQNLELYVAQLYARDTGRKLHKSRLYRDREFPFMAANPDYEVRNERPLRLVECKTAGQWSGQEFGSESDAVPNQYLIQCMWQLMCTGREICDLAVLIGGQDYRVYTIKRDDELIVSLRQAAREFWTTYILNETPPPITGDSPDTKLVNGQYPQNTHEVMYATPELEETMRALRDCDLLAKKVSREVERLKNEIKCKMADCAEIHSAEVGKVSWKCDKNGTRRFVCTFKEEPWQQAISREPATAVAA